MVGIRHNLSIDLSEHFQFAPNGRAVPRRHWARLPSRVERNAQEALRLLDRHDAKATFFVDDWIATRHAPLVEAIARKGHEIAAQMSRDGEFGSTVADLEAAACQVVHGWRPAPGRPAEIASDRLRGTGLRYVVGPSGAGASPEQRPGLDVIQAGSYAASGEWLRLMPEVLVARFVRSWSRAGAARTFTFSVWELDPATPRISTRAGVDRLRAYRNLSRFADRLDRLLSETRFVPLRDRLGLGREPTSRCQHPVAADLPAPPEAPAGEPVSIVVPCFNEEPGLAYLRNTLAELDAGFGRRHRLSFVLVDDGSTDGTWAEMKRLFGDDPRVERIRHDRNRGIGAAILTGIFASKNELVAVMDSDCSYDPARIEEMLPLLEPDVAIVTASPYHVLGGVEGVPQWRLFLSRGASRLYRSVLRNKLATYTSCFRVCRKAAVTGLALRHEGYIGVVEMLARLDLEGWRIVEHPVTLEARLLGQSKLKVARAITEHLRFVGEICVARLGARARPDVVKVTR